MGSSNPTCPPHRGGQSPLSRVRASSDRAPPAGRVSKLRRWRRRVVPPTSLRLPCARCPRSLERALPKPGRAQPPVDVPHLPACRRGLRTSRATRLPIRCGRLANSALPHGRRARCVGPRPVLTGHCLSHRHCRNSAVSLSLHNGQPSPRPCRAVGRRSAQLHAIQLSLRNVPLPWPRAKLVQHTIRGHQWRKLTAARLRSGEPTRHRASLVPLRRSTARHRPRPCPVAMLSRRRRAGAQVAQGRLPARKCAPRVLLRRGPWLCRPLGQQRCQPCALRRIAPATSWPARRQLLSSPLPPSRPLLPIGRPTSQQLTQSKAKLGWPVGQVVCRRGGSRRRWQLAGSLQAPLPRSQLALTSPVARRGAAPKQFQADSQRRLSRASKQRRAICCPCTTIWLMRLKPPAARAQPRICASRHGWRLFLAARVPKVVLQPDSRRGGPRSALPKGRCRGQGQVEQVWLLRRLPARPGARWLPIQLWRLCAQVFRRASRLAPRSSCKALRLREGNCLGLPVWQRLAWGSVSTPVRRWALRPPVRSRCLPPR